MTIELLDGDDLYEDADLEVFEAEFTSLSTPTVSDNLLDTDLELDNLLDAIDLEDCDLDDFEVLING